MARRRAVAEDQVPPSMPAAKAVELLRSQAAKSDSLTQLPYDDPQIDAWESFTEQVIIRAFGKPHENLNAFHMARIGGPMYVNMSDAALQENHVTAMRRVKTLLLSFADQLEAFDVPTQDERPRVEKDVSNKVFIVHGHAGQPKIELALLLTQLGLDPIILHEQPNQGMTLIEKLERHSEVGYAFILLTPDDLGCEAGRVTGDWRFMKGLLRPRARQNVVFEFGRFAGLLGRSRVCCLHTGKVELPSDVHGLVYIPFRSSVNEIRFEIVKELRAAGYDVKV